MAGSYTERLTQMLNVAGLINPVSQAAGTVTTGAIDLRLHRRVVFYIINGVLGASGTVDFAVKGDTTSGGAFTTTVIGAVITQLVKATNDNSVAQVEITAESLLAQGYRFVKGSLTVGTATSLVSVLALSDNDRYHPAQDNVAALVQTVAI